VGLSLILVYENGDGVVALNLPVSRQVVGAKATRTAHPKVLEGLAQILSRVAGVDFSVTNPFALRTRAEIIGQIVECGAADLIKNTVSCAYVHKSSTEHPHCGVCSQCVDRQLSMRVAGAEQHDSELGYGVHLENGEWSDEDARVMLLDYLDAAERFSRCKTKEELLSLFGEMTRAIRGSAEMGRRDAAHRIASPSRRRPEGARTERRRRGGAPDKERGAERGREPQRGA